MNIKVSNPNLLKTIDYRLLKPLQGNLKGLNETNYNKLKNVLLKRGFTTPFFVWADTSKPSEHFKDLQEINYYLLDGHQRQRVMLQEDMNHEGSYQMPYIEIKAKSRRDAKAQLLEISSQYGKVIQEGFDEFTDELENEDFEDVAFDALSYVGGSDEDNQSKDNNQHAIIVSFSVPDELDICLLDIQEICEKYDSAQIRVKE